ncbi:hypothetical protein Hanom_Chr09g00847061 [Helianthus anomalus]
MRILLRPRRTGLMTMLSCRFPVMVIGHEEEDDRSCRFPATKYDERR